MLESQLPWRVTGAGKWNRTQASEFSLEGQWICSLHTPDPRPWWRKTPGSQVPGPPGLPCVWQSSLLRYWRKPHTNTSIHAPLDIGFCTLTWPRDCAEPPESLLWFIRRAAGEKARDGSKGQILKTLYKLFLGVLFCIKGAILEYFRQENRIKFWVWKRPLWLGGGGADNKSRKPVRYTYHMGWERLG